MSLKTLRIAARLSQEELADRSGVSQQLISKIERGERANQTLDTARSIVSTLNERGVACSIDDVFPGEKPKRKKSEAA